MPSAGDPFGGPLPTPLLSAGQRGSASETVRVRAELMVLSRLWDMVRTSVERFRHYKICGARGFHSAFKCPARLHKRSRLYGAVQKSFSSSSIFCKGAAAFSVNRVFWGLWLQSAFVLLLRACVD